MARVRLELPDDLPFTTELTVRVTDLNYGGHVGNDTILAFAHEARARFLASHGLQELDVDGRGIIIADAVVVYRAESFFGERLRVSLGAGDFNKYGCDIFYRFEKEDATEVARAKTGLVFFDYGARRIAKAPEAFLALFR